MASLHFSTVIYSFLLLFRIFVCPFLQGYVHPDEFFQGGQELFFGCQPNIPWEFEPSNALRSILPPIVMTWLPLQIYKCLRDTIERVVRGHEMIIGHSGLSGTEILIVPRIACSICSILVIDRGLWSVCDTGDKQKESLRVPIPVLLLASAWPTVVMLTRPFSNSMETYILASLMTDVFTMKTDGVLHSSSFMSNYFCWKIGVICSLGIFTRFTFVFFAAPILLFLSFKMIQMFGIRNAILWKKLGWMATSFMCLSLVIIQADSVFYSSRRGEVIDHSSAEKTVPKLFFNYSSLVVTPFNMLAYNSKISNLKDHGLHPRWTHAVVNMLIMYGPLALATYFFMAVTLRSRVGRNVIGDFLNRKTIEQGDFVIVSAAVIIFGLGFLSIAPHQEPRFLLPLLLPLVLFGEKPIRRFPTTCVCIWAIFNLILIMLYGILHQGGVTKSLLAVGSSTSWAQQKHPTSWIYMRTYMPPTFLTRRDTPNDVKICPNDDEEDVYGQKLFQAFGFKDDDACQTEKVHIVDMKSATLDELRERIQRELPCSNHMLSSDSNSFLYLVVPLFVGEKRRNYDCDFILSQNACESHFQLSNTTYEWNHVSTYGSHLSTEDFPPFGDSFVQLYKMLALNVYNISCAMDS